MGRIDGKPESYGLIPRICFSLFEELSVIRQQTAQGGGAQTPSSSLESVDTFVTFSHMEIYNENVRDLLVNNGNNNHPSRIQQKSSLKVREHPQKGVFVAGLTHVRVTTFEEVMSLIEVGDRNRTVAATNSNAHSSRSHAIVTLTVVQRMRHVTADTADTDSAQLPTSSLQTKEGRVHLVDLAGSERVNNSGAKATRLKEACR